MAIEQGVLDRPPPDQAPRDRPLERWNGATPLLMSAVVLAMIALDLARHGFNAPRHDETAADHVAILLMFGQIPIMASFVHGGQRELRRIAPVALAQIALWALTFGAAYL